MAARSLRSHRRRRSESILNSFVRTSTLAKLSERYFVSSEHTAIMQVTEEQRVTRFFRYWVVKEALLKAHGIGLLGLPDCEIFLEADGADDRTRTRLGSRFRIRYKFVFSLVNRDGKQRWLLNGWTRLHSAVQTRNEDSIMSTTVVDTPEPISHAKAVSASGCSKWPSSKAAARSATRRIMSVTFADGRESVSAQCLKGEA